MAGSRIPGPLGMNPKMDCIDKGTVARIASPLPGPVGITQRTAWAPVEAPDPLRKRLVEMRIRLLEEAIATKGESLDVWIDALGITAPPAVKNSVREAVKFMMEMEDPSNEEERRKERKETFQFLLAIDFHQPLWFKKHEIGRSQLLTQRGGGKVGPFFSLVGVAGQNVGINTDGRTYRLWKVIEPFEVLESKAAGTVDYWTERGRPVLVDGGGTQMLVKPKKKKDEKKDEALQTWVDSHLKLIPKRIAKVERRGG